MSARGVESNPPLSLAGRESEVTHLLRERANEQATLPSSLGFSVSSEKMAAGCRPPAFHPDCKGGLQVADASAGTEVVPIGACGGPGGDRGHPAGPLAQGCKS